MYAMQLHNTILLFSLYWAAILLPCSSGTTYQDLDSVPDCRAVWSAPCVTSPSSRLWPRQDWGQGARSSWPSAPFHLHMEGMVNIFFFCLRGRSPSLPSLSLHYDTISLQRIRIIVRDAGFEPGTSAPEVWSATNESPYPPNEPPHLPNEPPRLRNILHPVAKRNR